MSIALPATIYALYFTCSEASGGCTPSLRSLPSDFVRAVGDKNWWFSLFDTKAAIAYASWYAYTIAAWYFLPGKWIEGTELRTGGRIKYKINGGRYIRYLILSANCVSAFATLAVTLGLTASWIICFGPSSFTFIYDHWIGFCTAALINAFVQAMWLYYISTKNTDLRLLALGGNTGNIIYDVRSFLSHLSLSGSTFSVGQWFIGRELNPSIGSLDLMYFNELRPGLILWFLCNISRRANRSPTVTRSTLRTQ